MGLRGDCEGKDLPRVYRSVSSFFSSTSKYATTATTIGKEPKPINVADNTNCSRKTHAAVQHSIAAIGVNTNIGVNALLRVSAGRESRSDLSIINLLLYTSHPVNPQKHLCFSSKSAKFWIWIDQSYRTTLRNAQKSQLGWFSDTSETKYEKNYNN